LRKFGKRRARDHHGTQQTAMPRHGSSCVMLF
jgi:hypothetical protein